MTIALTSELLDPSEIRHAVDIVLEDFLAAKSQSAPSPELAGIIDTLREFLFAGGKRIRPVMCLCGWHAARGRGDPRPVLQAAASLELFHAFALIQDDVMDDSAIRRGRPSVHRELAGRRPDGVRTAAGRFGANAAILLSDLALTWSDEMLHTAELTPDQLDSALPVLDTMRTELMFGQYLDLLAAGRPTGDVGQALAISRYKTAKYTIERPLHFGAALAGSGLAVAEACTAYGIPTGEAFQLRDDLLGVFGDPQRTGKPVIDDLREGKCTALMALAVLRATPAQLRLLRFMVGHPGIDEARADAVRAVLDATGARQETERMITVRHREALDALDSAPFPAPVTAVLRQLAHAVSARAV
ncbi:polyprenyl synthetase family protein [Streptomyces gobiensis]|uniref:polyprenyl synthetase family protein n=1 Tax=Streptomyces gobiensis TaxID=2875706 RepID=UPI001E4BFBEC|nr:polyprenyl synthetase family protein [Streptomyces gobiensis]UGY94655.1 polyprenyl synthetase family protein [Streptomyces gobiensis]